MSALLGIFGSADAAANDQVTGMLRAADAPRHVLEEGTIRVRATVREKKRPPVSTELEVYVKGNDRMRCVFLEGSQKGREVLSVGAHTWLLIPGASRPIPVSPNQRLLGGASIGDLGRLRFADEYEATLRDGQEEIDGVACRVLDLRAKSPRSSYGSGVLWMGKEDLLPRKVRLALPSGKPAKEATFIEFGRESGKTVLRRMEVRHLLFAERGATTSLEFLRYEPRILEDALFDPERARERP